MAIIFYKTDLLRPAVRDERRVLVPGWGEIRSPFQSVAATDAFTDVDGTVLTAHTPDSGGSWAKNTLATNTVHPTIDENRVHGENAASTSIYYHSHVPASPNYAVQGDIVLRTDNNLGTAGVCARMAPAANTYYAAYYSTLSNQWALFGVVAGASAFATLTQSQNLTLNVPYRVVLSVRGTLLEMFVNGTLILAKHDAAISAANRAGIRLTSNATATTGPHIDAWAVYT